VKRSKLLRNRGRYQPGEHFALVPCQVMESDAYRALPDWAKVPVVALAGQYRGARNGDISLTWREARQLGVSAQWKLRAGLKLAERVGLIDMTRLGGNVAGGEKWPTLYALGWLPIEHSDKFTSPPGSTLKALNRWATWTRPHDWDLQTKTERHKSQAKKNGHPTRVDQTAPPVNSESEPTRHTRGEREHRKPDTHGRVTSRDLPRGAEISALRLLEAQPHLSNFDVAKAMAWKIDPYRIGVLRQHAESGTQGEIRS
jgi:hypothetical protein